MSPSRAALFSKAERGITAAFLAYASWFTLRYLLIAAGTVPYPYQLEWMEGGILETVARVGNGEPLYVAPSIDYVSYVYTPLYYYLGALFTAIGGLALPPLRLLSLLATLATSILITLFIHRETGSKKWAALGAPLFLA
ncbi:MAG: hypothetical protein KC416_14455, partial [Myxococcales bacterium]|nr:hypothetical protein [Myxococcales bacterium]